jgi:hypothetical protein
MRTCILTTDEQKTFDPVKFTGKLKAAGFEFDRETCPVKIKRPWAVKSLPDGSAEYRQWDEYTEDDWKSDQYAMSNGLDVVMPDGTLVRGHD